MKWFHSMLEQVGLREITTKQFGVATRYATAGFVALVFLYVKEELLLYM